MEQYCGDSSPPLLRDSMIYNRGRGRGPGFRMFHRCYIPRARPSRDDFTSLVLVFGLNVGKSFGERFNLRQGVFNQLRERELENIPSRDLDTCQTSTYPEPTLPYAVKRLTDET